MLWSRLENQLGSQIYNQLKLQPKTKLNDELDISLRFQILHPLLSQLGRQTQTQLNNNCFTQKGIFTT